MLAANLALPEHGLVKLTWGNVSGLDRDAGVMAIKPSGVPYDGMTARGHRARRSRQRRGHRAASGGRQATPPRTSPCTARWRSIGGIVHTHSTYATAWAQAEREIPLLGTTHADFSAEPVPADPRPDRGGGGARL